MYAISTTPFVMVFGSGWSLEVTFGTIDISMVYKTSDWQITDDYGLYNSYMLLASFLCERVHRKALFDSNSFAVNRPQEKCKIRNILFHRVILYALYMYLHKTDVKCMTHFYLSRER